MDEEANLSQPKKKTRKLTAEDKEKTIEIFKKVARDKPHLKKDEKVNLTAKLAGVSVATIYNLLRKYERNNAIGPPKIYLPDRYSCGGVSNEAKCLIRKRIHTSYMRNISPKLSELSCELESKGILPELRKSTFIRLLQEIGFRYHRDTVTEKIPIICSRRRYLTDVKKFRRNKTKIYYLDEISVDIPQNTNPDALAYQSDKPVEEKRFQVIHIGSEEGSVEDGLFIFECKKNEAEIYEEINVEIFEEWFKNVLPKLEEGCAIVLDNKSHHNRKIDVIPTFLTPKAEIQDWLKSKGIAYEEDMVRAELLQLVKENKPETEDNYVVDKMAKETGRTVLRLPLYHCDLNPIEILWNQIKGDLAVKASFTRAIENVTAEDWKNAVESVLKVEEELWQMDDLMEEKEETERMNGSRSDSDTSSSDSDYEWY